MAISPRAALGFALPLAAAVGCGVLALFWVAPGVDLAAMTRGSIGPATWPKAMLFGAAACGALLCLRNLAATLTGHGERAPAPATADSVYHELRSLGALALLAAYGAAIPLVGIAWATMLFLIAWMLLGGVRRPAVIVPVAMLGTTALLYVFVKLSQMPLDRGKGVFEQATIVLYRLLGIY